MIEIVKEPTTPAAANRLTAQERQWLHAQRQYNLAEANGDVESMSAAAKVLGLEFDIELEDGPCGCGPKTVYIKEGPLTHKKELSAFHPLRHVPQGTLWHCLECDCQFIATEPPDTASKQIAKAQVDFPGKGHGPDHIVIGDCDACKKD